MDTDTTNITSNAQQSNNNGCSVTEQNIPDSESPVDQQDSRKRKTESPPDDRPAKRARAESSPKRDTNETIIDAEKQTLVTATLDDQPLKWIPVRERKKALRARLHGVTSTKQAEQEQPQPPVRQESRSLLEERVEVLKKKELAGGTHCVYQQHLLTVTKNQWKKNIKGEKRRKNKKF